MILENITLGDELTGGIIAQGRWFYPVTAVVIIKNIQSLCRIFVPVNMRTV